MKSFFSYAKVNIFLKITKKRANYHEICSRFILYKDLYDEISFVAKCSDREFELSGDFSCELSQNSIYKAYMLLKDEFGESVGSFFDRFGVEVVKNIKEGSGLGGGSSNAATFILALIELLNLKISRDRLFEIGLKIGADVPFFLSGYLSANVSGIGEIVSEFEDSSLDLELFTPNISCETKAIYTCFRERFYKEFEDTNLLTNKKSIDILKEFDGLYLNDLFAPAIYLHRELDGYRDRYRYFSGSGSTLFRLKGD